MSPDVNVKEIQPEIAPPLVNNSASDTTCGVLPLKARIREVALWEMNRGGSSAAVAEEVMALLVDERASLRRAAEADGAERVLATLNAWEGV